MSRARPVVHRNTKLRGFSWPGRHAVLRFRVRPRLGRVRGVPPDRRPSDLMGSVRPIPARVSSARPVSSETRSYVHSHVPADNAFRDLGSRARLGHGPNSRLAETLGRARAMTSSRPSRRSYKNTTASDLGVEVSTRPGRDLAFETSRRSRPDRGVTAPARWS